MASRQPAAVWKARFVTGFAICALLLALCVSGEAQQAADKIPRIGFLQRRIAPTPSKPDPLANAFLQGLRELGYIDGQNIVIEHRYAEGHSERLSRIIAEFLHLKGRCDCRPG